MNTITTFLTEEEIEEDRIRWEQYHETLLNAINNLKNVLGPAVKITLTTEYGSSVEY